MCCKDEIVVLCRNISWLRKKHGLSKRKMAEILGVGVKALSLIEQGILPSRVGCDMLFNASDYFHITVSELFCSMYE